MRSKTNCQSAQIDNLQNKNLETEFNEEMANQEKFKDFNEFFDQIYGCEFITTTLSSVALNKLEQYTYQGFDVSRLLQVFWLKASNMSKFDIMKDVYQLLAIGLLRANIREDQLDKTTAEGRIQIVQLANKYGITLRKSRTERVKLSPETLTFVRIVSMFPLHASLLIHKKPILSVKFNLSGKYGSKLCPIELKHSGAAAIIPFGEVGDVFMAAHIGYMMELGEEIDQNSESTPLVRFENQKRYALIARNSITVSSLDRAAGFKAMGLDRLVVYRRTVDACNEMRKSLGLNVIAYNDKLKIISDSIIIDESVDAAATILSKKMVMNVLSEESGRTSEQPSTSKVHHSPGPLDM